MANCINIICRFHRAALYVDKYRQQVVFRSYIRRSFVAISSSIIEIYPLHYTTLTVEEGVKEKRCVNFETKEEERKERKKRRSSKGD